MNERAKETRKRFAFSNATKSVDPPISLAGEMSTREQLNLSRWCVKRGIFGNIASCRLIEWTRHQFSSVSFKRN